jgi:dTDP-glucose 4,6-dehydratase
VYNIGANKLLTNNQIAELMLEMTGNKRSKVEYIADRLGHDKRYALDVTKIENELGWSATADFREELKKVILY